MGAGGSLRRGGPPTPIPAPPYVQKAAGAPDQTQEGGDRLCGLGQVTSLLWASGSSSAGV